MLLTGFQKDESDKLNVIPHLCICSFPVQKSLDGPMGSSASVILCFVLLQSHQDTRNPTCSASHTSAHDICMAHVVIKHIMAKQISSCSFCNE